MNATVDQVKKEKKSAKNEINPENLLDFLQSQGIMYEASDIKTIHLYENVYRINVWREKTHADRICKTFWIEDSFFTKVVDGVIENHTRNSQEQT